MQRYANPIKLKRQIVELCIYPPRTLHTRSCLKFYSIATHLAYAGQLLSFLSIDHMHPAVMLGETYLWLKQSNSWIRNLINADVS